jgi:ribosomal protein S18 acetylase RimI-like enzyme
VDFGERVLTAHVDGWEVEGLLRAGAARVGGARLMCSGLPEMQWNGAWVTGSPVDLEAIGHWFAERHCPWGLAVPRIVDYEPHGERITSLRLMGLEPRMFSPPASADPRVRLRRASRDDLELLVALDVNAFGGSPDVNRQWIAPPLGAPGFTHWIADYDDRPVGMAIANRTNSDAGPAAAITGVGVIEEVRRRGIGAAVTARACAGLFELGAELIQLSPNTELAARVYQRLGFQEVPGLTIYRV